MAIVTVAIVGANGTLGPSVLNAILATSTFQVTVVSRKGSKSKYPDAVQLAHVSDDPTPEELEAALRDQDAVVCTFGGTSEELQIRYADAAARAGVKRFIPADFGSCDSASPRAMELMSLYGAKTRVREHLQRLAEGGSMSWTSLVTGHFFDFGMRSGLFQFDLASRKALIFDDGNYRWSASFLDQIGLATAGILQREAETKNRMLYVQSVNTTQNEVLDILEAKMPGWQVSRVSSQRYIEDTKKKVDADAQDQEAKENLVSVLGVIEGNWQEKADFANALLGLETESTEKALDSILNS